MKKSNKFKVYREVLISIISVILFNFSMIGMSHAQDSLCAEVKIVIEQKLSFERQAFDAKMVISNGLTDSSVKDINIELVFEDKNNQPLVATEDTNASGAKFFYRLDSLAGIDSIKGKGSIAPKSSAQIHWLIIPSSGAAPDTDTLYYVGAKVTYNLNGQQQTVNVTPDYVIVKPQPILSLDYFLPKEVYADDPFTPEIEAAIPFTLGVRIKNVGAGYANNTVIESAQPKIVENKQNLLIGFSLLDSYVSDEVVANTLLLQFGDIPPKSAKVGRWSMVTTLSGKFTEFTAKYSHADTLGGLVTSLIKEINTHTLVHDIKVDLAERDTVRDFLAYDYDVLRVYESEGIDTEVKDVTTQAVIEKSADHYTITFPKAEGFIFARLLDPFQGTVREAEIIRSDGKALLAENVWFSKEQQQDHTWLYYFNIFDISSTGKYELKANNTEVKKSFIAGIVYDDVNKNGAMDKGESPIPLVNIILTGINNKGGNVKQIGYTNDQGVFIFTELESGQYALEAEAVDGMQDGNSSSGNAEGAETSSRKITHLIVNKGKNIEGILFAKQAFDGGSTLERANLSLALQLSPIKPVVGKNIILTYTVKNTGPSSAINTVVNLDLPEELSIVNSRPSVGSFEGGVWKIGNLRQKATHTLRITAKLNKLIENKLLISRVTSQTADPDFSNNTATSLLKVSD